MIETVARPRRRATLELRPREVLCRPLRGLFLLGVEPLGEPGAQVGAQYREEQLPSLIVQLNSR